MSANEKQEFLRQNIIEAGYEAEVFINFLEGKREDGSNVDVWELPELVEAVAEFKNSMEEGETIERRKTTRDE
jgi:hypothetical protein